MQKLKSKILIIEDDQNSNKLLNDFLSAHGALTVCTYNGIDALQELEKNFFDIILLDLRLPGQNGFVVAEQIRKKTTTSAIPIIAISAFTDQQNKIRAYQAGVNYFVSKPINTHEILWIIINLEYQKKASILDYLRTLNQTLEIQGQREGHAERIMALCTSLAQLKKLPPEDIKILQTAGRFHDIGLLNKTGNTSHPEQGAKIVSALGLPEIVATIIYFHHNLPDSAKKDITEKTKKMIEILQIAEKTEEYYKFFPDILTEDYYSGKLDSTFYSYISTII